MASVVAELWRKDGTKTTHRFPTKEEYEAYPQYAIVREGIQCPWSQEVKPLDISIQEDKPKRKYTRRKDADFSKT